MTLRELHTTIDNQNKKNALDSYIYQNNYDPSPIKKD